MQPSTMISTVGETRRLRESSTESSNRSLAIATSVFALGLTAALIFVALIVKFIMPNLRRRVPQLQHHPLTTRAASSSGQRRHELVVTIPVHIYEAEPPPPSPSSADTTSYEVETCVICLGEFEKGERVSVLPRCKHMFHKDCISQWVPEKSMSCPMCRVPTADRVGRSAGRSGRVAAEMAGVENGSLSSLLDMSFAGTMATSSITGSGL